MLLNYRYRIYPTRAQVSFLEGELREACSLYNAALGEKLSALVDGVFTTAISA